MIKKVGYILFVLGLLLIFTGLILQIHNDKEIIKEKDAQIDNLAKEVNKLNAENQALWDNYYMNVTNYEGYEYYE